jgi:hypothetical protein
MPITKVEGRRVIMGGSTTLKVVKDATGDVKTTHMITSGALKATASSGNVLSKIEAAAPFVEKVVPWAEKAAPIVEKAAVPLAVIAGGTKATYEFSQGHHREGSQTLGSTGGAIGGGIAGAEGGAAIGTLICPGVGTVVGGVIGGIGGGFAGSAAGKYVGGWIHDGIAGISNWFNHSSSGQTHTASPAPQVRGLAPALAR